MSFSFYYPNTPYSLPTSTVIDLSCALVGALPASTVFTISPALPTGLSINSTNGTIGGTTLFTSISPLKTYYVDASASTYVVSTTLEIEVNFLPVFYYPFSPYILKKDVATSIVPIYLISNIQGISYSIISSPPLSDISMNLRSTDGLIFGTPTPFSVLQSYTIRAYNGGITYDTSLNISVQSLPTINYPQSTYILTQGIPVDIIPDASIFNTNVVYSISNCPLPNGLNFSTTTGQIYGTPLLPTTFRKYIITITNNIGASNFVLIMNVIKEILAPPVLADNINTGLCLTNPVIAMRRKAEILKYKNNSATLTKKQYWSMAVQGKGPYARRVWANQNDLGSNPNISGLPTQGNIIICNDNTNGVKCSPSSSSDVPGTVTTLCYDPSIPLVGYTQPNRTKVNIGFKWPQRTWRIGDMGFPVGKAGNGNS